MDEFQKDYANEGSETQKSIDIDWLHLYEDLPKKPQTDLSSETHHHNEYILNVRGRSRCWLRTELSGAMVIFNIVTGVWITHVYVFVKPHQMVCLRCMRFLVYKIYLKNRNITSIEPVNYMHGEVSRIKYRNIYNSLWNFIQKLRFDRKIEIGTDG